MVEPVFLGIVEILMLHDHQIRRYGGRLGLRDGSLLESALAMPRATFEGSYLHTDLYEMAAATMFHLTQNHAFVDGNKRVGLAAALAFLGMNGRRIIAGEDELVDLALGVATGETGKSEVAVFLKKHARPRLIPRA